MRVLQHYCAKFHTVNLETASARWLISKVHNADVRSGITHQRSAGILGKPSTSPPSRHLHLGHRSSHWTHVQHGHLQLNVANRCSCGQFSAVYASQQPWSWPWPFERRTDSVACVAVYLCFYCRLIVWESIPYFSSFPLALPLPTLSCCPWQPLPMLSLSLSSALRLLTWRVEWNANIFGFAWL